MFAALRPAPPTPRNVMARGGPEPQAAGCSGRLSHGTAEREPGVGLGHTPSLPFTAAGKITPSRGFALPHFVAHVSEGLRVGPRAPHGPRGSVPIRALPSVTEGHSTGPEDFLLTPGPPSPSMPQEHG